MAPLSHMVRPTYQTTKCQTLPRMSDADEHEQPQPAQPRREAPRPPIYTSGELLQGAREFWIEHGDEMYRVRLTSRGKLYLCK